jgi:hypothetical protein
MEAWACLAGAEVEVDCREDRDGRARGVAEAHVAELNVALEARGAGAWQGQGGLLAGGADLLFIIYSLLVNLCYSFFIIYSVAKYRVFERSRSIKIGKYF